MGQYHFIANHDRREYLHPHRFGDGLKLMEFGCSGTGTMLGLALLLAASNGRGGGDLHMWTPNPDRADTESSPWVGSPIDPEHEAPGDYAQLLFDKIIGRWAGERISILGDYWEAEDVLGIDIADSNPWVHSHDRLSEEEGWATTYNSETGQHERTKLIPFEDRWTDISSIVLQAMMLDHYVREDLTKAFNSFGGPKLEAVLYPDGTIVQVKAPTAAE